MKRTTGWLGTGAAAFVTAATTAQCGYDVEPIYGPPAPPPHNFLYGLLPSGMNDNDQIVGRMVTLWSNYAFKWSPVDGLTVLDIPIEAESSRAYDINNLGTIVGNLSLTGVGTRGFVLTASGEFTLLQYGDGAHLTEAFAVNDSNVVVGTLHYPPTGQKEAYRWEAGEFEVIGPFELPASRAWDISNNGLITGYTGNNGYMVLTARAFIWQDGEHVLLPPIPGGHTSRGLAINNRGDVTGSGHVGDPEIPAMLSAHAFLYTAETGMLDLGVPSGFDHTTGLDIASDGTVVGWIGAPFGESDGGFVYRDGQFLDLDQHVPLNVAVGGAWAINSHGHIAGEGNFDDEGAMLLLKPDAPGDVNGDCWTDSEDLMLLLQDWGATNSPADLDGNGIVNGADLGILLGALERALIARVQS